MTGPKKINDKTPKEKYEFLKKIKPAMERDLGKKFSTAELLDLANMPGAAERQKKCTELAERQTKQQTLYKEKYKDQDGKAYSNGTVRLVSSFLKLEDTPEADQANKEFLKSITTEKGYKDFIYNVAADLLSADPSFYVASPHMYDIDSDLIRFDINKRVGFLGFASAELCNDKALFSPEVNEMYDDYIFLLEGAGSYRQKFGHLRNDYAAILPEVTPDEKVELLLKLEQDGDTELSWTDSEAENKKILRGIEEKADLMSHLNNEQFSMDVFDKPGVRENLVPTNYATDAEGKKLSLKEALKRIDKGAEVGKDVKFVQREQRYLDAYNDLMKHKTPEPPFQSSVNLDEVRQSLNASAEFFRSTQSGLRGKFVKMTPQFAAMQKSLQDALNTMDTLGDMNNAKSLKTYHDAMKNVQTSVRNYLDYKKGNLNGDLADSRFNEAMKLGQVLNREEARGRYELEKLGTRVAKEKPIRFTCAASVRARQKNPALQQAFDAKYADDARYDHQIAPAAQNVEMQAQKAEEPKKAEPAAQVKENAKRVVRTSKEGEEYYQKELSDMKNTAKGLAISGENELYRMVLGKAISAKERIYSHLKEGKGYGTVGDDIKTLIAEKVLKSKGRKELSAMNAEAEKIKNSEKPEEALNSYLKNLDLGDTAQKFRNSLTLSRGQKATHKFKENMLKQMKDYTYSNHAEHAAATANKELAVKQAQQAKAPAVPKA